MSQAKVDEWLNADKGSPWRHHASGGGIMHRDAGGGIDTGTGIGGPTPTAANQNPIVQGQYQQYASLPTEKLMELAARMGGSPQGGMIQRVIQQRHISPQAAPQQPQQSPQFARGGATKRADGGMMSSSEASPWWTRSEAHNENSGFLHGVTPGRADSVNTTAPGGSYIVPADVISGLGEGNSLAGARIMDRIVNTGPHGIPLPREGRGMGPPRAPAPFREAKGGAVKVFPERAMGGAKAAGETPVMLSHGEYVVPTTFIRKIGRGDLKRGHRILDAWIIEQRKKQIKKLKKLPGPVKS